MSVKTEREKHEKDLKELRDRNVERGLVVHGPPEIHQDIFVTVFDEKTGETKAEKVGEIHAFGGKVYVEVNGAFSRDDTLTLEQTVAAAFQAVS